jgi:hypothetical protein
MKNYRNIQVYCRLVWSSVLDFFSYLNLSSLFPYFEQRGKERKRGREGIDKHTGSWFGNLYCVSSHDLNLITYFSCYL